MSKNLVIFLMNIAAVASLQSCEKSPESQHINYIFNQNDSLVYKVYLDDLYLTVHHRRLRYNDVKQIKVLVFDSESHQVLSDVAVNLTVVNKGRRKKIELFQSGPGVFNGIVELNFSGLSSLDFEVVTGDYTSAAMVEQEVIRD
jgi:hypothetical protein